MVNGFYCAGNWKMNMNVEQAAQFARQLKADAPKDQVAQSQLLVFPPKSKRTKVVQGHLFWMAWCTPRSSVIWKNTS